MGWLILILVLLAAAFGVLVAVVKAVAFIVLTILLTIAALVAIVWYSFKAQIRRWEREGIQDRSHESRNGNNDDPNLKRDARAKNYS